MSERLCPGCGRDIGWDFITRKDGTRDLVSCWDLPNSYGRPSSYTCREWHEMEVAEIEADRKANAAEAGR